jgi:hypothetical protein
MKRFLSLTCVILVPWVVSPAQSAAPSAAKVAATASIDRHRSEFIGLADRIWEFAETALRE